MGDPNQVYKFEVILLGNKDQPRVLESDYIPASECTKAVAQRLFIERYEDPNYTGPHKISQPGAVRFLDHNRTEILRYDYWEYAKERGAERAAERLNASDPE